MDLIDELEYLILNSKEDIVNDKLDNILINLNDLSLTTLWILSSIPIKGSEALINISMGVLVRKLNNLELSNCLYPINERLFITIHLFINSILLRIKPSGFSPLRISILALLRFIERWDNPLMITLIDDLDLFLIESLINPTPLIRELTLDFICMNRDKYFQVSHKEDYISLINKTLLLITQSIEEEEVKKDYLNMINIFINTTG